MRTGTAYLPLHSGKAPLWLLKRMSRLASLIIELIIRDYGVNTLLDKLSDPFWFQALGNFLGFDWHSSGLTTTLCAALKLAVENSGKGLGIFVAGGKGKYALSTPEEIKSYAERHHFDPSHFIYASRMSAKVDSVCLQDGYELYQHTFIFTPGGEWAVIQQGMNPDVKLARRYHWRGNLYKDFIVEPHSGIICPRKGSVLNLTAKESSKSRDAITELVQLSPDRNLREYKKIRELKMDLKFNYKVDMELRRFESILNRIREKSPRQFVELIETEGVGPATLRALTLLAHLIYGAEPSFRDPAVYSYAHGGKDGIPYPVNRIRYEQTIRYLNNFLRSADPRNKLDIKEFLKITI